MNVMMMLIDPLHYSHHDQKSFQVQRLISAEAFCCHHPHYPHRHDAHCAAHPQERVRQDRVPQVRAPAQGQGAEAAQAAQPTPSATEEGQRRPQASEEAAQRLRGAHSSHPRREGLECKRDHRAEGRLTHCAVDFVEYWRSQGAQVSDRVAKLLKGYELRAWWFEIFECGRKARPLAASNTCLAYGPTATRPPLLAGPSLALSTPH